MADTVKFNVGGRHFEVSRTLINQHPNSMLAKMISETWEKKQDEPLFIDRDGDKFLHVLDYMRYGSIELPALIPRAMFQRELDYYGIESHDDTVKEEHTLIEFARNNAKELNQLKAKVARRELISDLLSIALECQSRLIRSAGDSVAFELYCNSLDCAPRHLKDEEKNELFEKYLNKYFGLTAKVNYYHKNHSIGGMCSFEVSIKN